MQKLFWPDRASTEMIRVIMRWFSWLMIGPSWVWAIAMVMKDWFINWRTGDLFSRKKPD